MATSRIIIFFKDRWSKVYYFFMPDNNNRYIVIKNKNENFIPHGLVAPGLISTQVMAIKHHSQI